MYHYDSKVWLLVELISTPSFRCHGIRSNHFMGNRWGNSGNSDRLFFGAPKSLQMVTAALKLKDTYSLEGKL